jgi:hypothetical protein
VSDLWAKVNGAHPTPQCATGAHAACSHLCGWAGTFNPRRHRFELGAPLCPCDCHASCPVTTSDDRLTVPTRSWLESCTCPGGEQQRREVAEAGIEPFDEYWRHRHAHKAALDAARARSRGRSRAEARDIYAAELRARGLPALPDAILDAAAPGLVASRAERMMMFGRAVTETTPALIKDLYRLRRQAHDDQPPPDPP